ncbi:hypothetical protein ACVWXL_004534 [Bradyrhizobium sp. GM22.5]
MAFTTSCLGLTSKVFAILATSASMLANGLIDGLLIVGDIALRHLLDDAILVLGDRAHEIVLLHGNLLLRHHGARTQREDAHNNHHPFHRFVSPLVEFGVRHHG